MDDEDEVDGDHIDYESTDSMTSTTHLPPDFIIPPKKEVEVAPPYLIKRSSSSVFYTGRACTSHQSSQQVQLQCCCWCHFSKTNCEESKEWGGPPVDGQGGPHHQLLPRPLLHGRHPHTSLPLHSLPSLQIGNIAGENGLDPTEVGRGHWLAFNEWPLLQTLRKFTFRGACWLAELASLENNKKDPAIFRYQFSTDCQGNLVLKFDSKRFHSRIQVRENLAQLSDYLSAVSGDGKKWSKWWESFTV